MDCINLIKQTKDVKTLKQHVYKNVRGYLKVVYANRYISK